MAPGYLGKEILIKKLTQILFTHIKHNMPSIQKEVKETLKHNERELADLDPALPVSKAEKMQLIWTMVREFTKAYENQIAGKMDPRQRALMEKGQGGSIQGGAKMKWQFHKLYADLEDFKASNEYTDAEIEKAIVNLEGINISGFPS